MKCRSCEREFDERIAVGVCPYCGAEYELPSHIVDGTDSVWVGEDPDDGGAKKEPHDVQRRPSETDPKWLPPGTILKNRYQVIRVLGAGGFGITYLVHDRTDRVEKAVKEYFQQGVVNRLDGETAVFISAPKRREEFEYGRARFLEEARMLAQFQSPYIVHVFDFFEENNTTYMVMEYLDYPTLEEYIIRRRAVLDKDEVIRIGVCLCEALELIHRAGMIHRDVAPDNIFITKDSVKLIDFGSARLSKEDTEDLLIVTKPGYAPPEQYEQITRWRDRQKAWTDVYALGATLYMALTGRIPVKSTDRVADSDRDEDSLPEPITINQNIGEQLNNTIMTAMAINIHERFANATVMKEALLEQRVVKSIQETRKDRKRRRNVSVAAGFLAAAVLFGIGVGKRAHDRAAIELPPASISVWYAESEDETLSQQKNAVMNSALESVRAGDAFTRVTIEMRAIPETEYAAEIEKAAQSGALPTLFETPAEPGSVMELTEDLSDVGQKIESGSCCFLDDYSKYFSSGDRFPIGFNVPVIYINTSLVPDYSEGTELQTMKDFMQLCGGDMKYMTIALNPADAELYAEMIPDFQEYSGGFRSASAEPFCQGEAVAYFSDTSDYYRVRSALPGYFAMAVVDADHLVCRFADFWSVRDCEDPAEEMAAETFLAYLTSNYVQDQYYLQTNLPGLPLEKNALRSYADVHPVFSEMLSDIESFTAVAP